MKSEVVKIYPVQYRLLLNTCTIQVAFFSLKYNSYIKKNDLIQNNQNIIVCVYI